MEDSPLRLVKASARADSRGAPPAAVWAVGLLIAGAAGLATIGGADEARRGFDPQKLALSALEASLEQTSRSAEARSRLTALRSVVARRPLDTRTRAVYASLLLSLSGNLDQLRAPAFHAGVAASLSPVTVPVVELAALVLAHAGETDRALLLAGRMFEYDPDSAAGLLARMEPLVDPGRIAGVLGDSPRAWLSWEHELRTRGRTDDAAVVLEEAHRRWPEDLAVTERLAAAAARRRDWAALRALFPAGAGPPGLAGSAILTAYRAIARATDRDEAGAREDLHAALRLDGGSSTVQMLAGDACLILGDWSEARRLWGAALFAVRPKDTLLRLSILLRLARLEQEHGEPAAALRMWRSVLEIQPDHDEAHRRIDELTGARR